MKVLNTKQGHVISFDPQVTMDVLVDMGREELKEIGVNTYGARHKIVKKIKELTTKGAVGKR